MEKNGILKGAAVALTLFAVWLAIRYLFGIFLPFLLGWLLALAAEPGVKFFQKRFRFSRGPASAVSVTLGLVLFGVLVWLLAALVYRELTTLAGNVPPLVEELTIQTARLRDYVIGWVRRAPAGLAGVMERAVSDLFTSGSVLLEKLATGLLSTAAKLVGGLSGGMLTLGIAVLSGYMISAQFPRLQSKLKNMTWLRKLKPMAERVKTALGGWLRAETKLIGVNFVIVFLGLLLLRVEGALLWAVLTALVDAVPVLGTGTVLIPWALVSLLQGESVQAIGLVGLYLTAMLTRSALEPKLLGRHLGLNPLVTLVAIYAGYRLWGIPGMIFSPILAVVAAQLAAIPKEDLHGGEDVI